MLKQIEKDNGITVTSYGKGGRVTLTKQKIIMGRVDVSGSDSMREIAHDYGIVDIPAIMIFPFSKSATKKERMGILYSGHQTGNIRKFITKILSPPAVRLNDVCSQRRFSNIA